MKETLDGLEGIHPPPKIPSTLRAGLKISERTGQNLTLVGSKELEAVRQPVARLHPDTGRRSIYLRGLDMDLGPFHHPTKTVEELPVLEHGADGEGAKLLRYLLTHGSQPQFVYAHEWQRGDLIVYDNRCTWCRCLISALLFARALRESA